MLTRFFADNYKSFVKFECQLQSRQLILGPNGSAKTTLFDVLSLLRDFCIRGEPAVREPPELSFLGRSRTRWHDEPIQTFELDVSGNGGLYKFRLKLDSWGNPQKPRTLLEEVTFSNKPIFRFEQGKVHLFNDRHEDKVQYQFDWHRSALATIDQRIDNTTLTWFKQWLGGLLVISPDPRQMLSGIADREEKNPDRHFAKFPNWLRHLVLETTRESYEYFNDLREAIDGFVSMRLEDAGESRREIRIAMASSDKQEYFMGELSEGQRVLIALYAALHFGLTPGATVCFDEPDNFIALREIEPWLTRVLERTETDFGAQVLIASHHPEMINRMAFKEGLFLDRPDGRNAIAKPFTDLAQTGLSASELVARGWER
jgi:hypothetical protein